LDDFVRQTNLAPTLVKMDIEGAEFDAIKGMEKTIEEKKPHLILETQREDARCLNWLRERGYIAIDLNTYHEIKNSSDYPSQSDIRNNLYIHQDKCSSLPYNPPLTFNNIITLKSDDFYIKSDGSFSLKIPIKLGKGRYTIDVNFTALGKDNELICGVKTEEKIIFQYHAYSHLLASTYRDWVINLSKASEINLYFKFLRQTKDPTFSIQGATISRVMEFDCFPSSLPI
jgi:hypothetical protein